MQAVLSQEGVPSVGVWRVSEVKFQVEQQRLGGGPADANHIRILDQAWAERGAPSQEEMLPSYPSYADAVGTLSPDDSVQVRMLRPLRTP